MALENFSFFKNVFCASSQRESAYISISIISKCSVSIFGYVIAVPNLQGHIELKILPPTLLLSPPPVNVPSVSCAFPSDAARIYFSFFIQVVHTVCYVFFFSSHVIEIASSLLFFYTLILPGLLRWV